MSGEPQSFWCGQGSTSDCSMQCSRCAYEHPSHKPHSPSDLDKTYSWEIVRDALWLVNETSPVGFSVALGRLLQSANRLRVHRA